MAQSLEPKTITELNKKTSELEETDVYIMADQGANTLQRVSFTQILNYIYNKIGSAWTFSATLGSNTVTGLLSAIIENVYTTLSSHTSNKSNPHSVTKSQVGLGNVENKSSETIRGELTKANVTDALGYTPPTADTNTHYTSKNVVGATTATSNTTSALTNGNVYLNSVENGAVTSTHKISGSGATTVTTDASGNIVIKSTNDNTTYSVATTSANGLMSSSDKSKLDAITASADAVSFTQSLTSGTAVGTLSINGTDTVLYAPSNTDTKVTNTLATTTKAYITGTTSATTNTGTQIFDTGVYLDTTAGRLVATTFKGALSGNATSATKATQDSDGSQINSTYVKKSAIVDNVTSTSTDAPLSANQGKVLQNQITELNTDLNTWTTVTISLTAPTTAWTGVSLTVSDGIGARRVALYDSTNETWVVIENIGGGNCKVWYTNGYGSSDGYIISCAIQYSFSNGILYVVAQRTISYNCPVFTKFAYQ